MIRDARDSPDAWFSGPTGMFIKIDSQGNLVVSGYIGCRPPQDKNVDVSASQLALALHDGLLPSKLQQSIGTSAQTAAERVGPRCFGPVSLPAVHQ